MRPQLGRQLRGLKWRALWVLSALGVGSSLTFYYRKEIFHLLLAPADGQLSPSGMPVFISPTEMFSVTIDLLIKGGLVLAIPMAAFQFYRFLCPLIGRTPRRLIRTYLLMGAALYLSGMAFAYFVMLPTGMQFLMQYGTDIATPMIRISEYIALAMALTFWLGFLFELPLAMMLLAHLRLVSYKQFRKVPRRYIALSAFILGAIVTPTFDMVNQTLVAVPLIVLYEVGVGLAYLVRPRVRR